ncbi:MAG TPA: YciI family protein [Acidiferrobacteraceae bacterium]|nr:YciI family protein [Acidiferrobacteraceae bacterium]
MYYAIIGRDKDDSLALRMAARPVHLSRLEALKDAGQLLIAGPFPAIDGNDPGPAGFSGSLIVAEFDSLEQATEWAHADPYAQQGVFKEVSVLPFKKVLP